jgi:hypothetical protein
MAGNASRLNPSPALPLKVREVYEQEVPLSDGDLKKKRADGKPRKWVAGASPR